MREEGIDLYLFFSFLFYFFYEKFKKNKHGASTQCILILAEGNDADTDTRSNVAESQVNYAKWKKSGKKEIILGDATYEKY